MSLDHQRQLAVDRIMSSIREAAEESLRSYASAVAESATDELRRESTVQIATLRDTVQRLEITRIDVESQLAEARRLLDEERSNAQQLIAESNATRDASIAAERLRADSAIDDATQRAQAELAAAQQRMELRVAELTGQLAAAQERARRCRLLADAAASLDAATSVGGVLERLADVAARIGPRAAVYVVKRETLRCWRSVGFEAPPEQPAGSSLLDGPPAVAKSVRERRLVVDSADDGAAGTSSSATAPAPASVAVPVAVAGRIVAAVYVEMRDVHASDLADWCPAVETLARYAGRALETLTVQQAMGAGRPLVRASHPGPGHPLSGGPS